jgi:hypothetical protein
MLRKPLAVLGATAFLLGAAGLALARGGAPNSLAPVSATFDAATVSHLRSSSCTGEDGTYTRTRATYTGTATGDDARWDGALTVRALSVYNTDTNLGYVVGRYRVATELGPTVGWFQAVNTNGTLTGFTDAFARGSRAWMLGSLSASFDSATGFSNGQFGAGSSNGAAVLAAGRCGDTPAQGGDVSVFTVKGKHGSGKHHMKGRRGGR